MPATSGIGRRRAAAKAEGGDSYQERRRQIMATAAKVFREKGLGRANLNDVADALGTDRASLYYYFSSKRELFQEIVHEVVEATVLRAEAVAKSKAPARDKLRTLIVELMSSYADNYPYQFVYIQENLNHTLDQSGSWDQWVWDLNKRFDDALVKILQSGFNDGSLEAKASARVVAYGIIGMVNWTHRWYDVEGPLTAAELGQTYADIVLKGLEPR